MNSHPPSPNSRVVPPYTSLSYFLSNPAPSFRPYPSLQTLCSKASASCAYIRAYVRACVPLMCLKSGRTDPASLLLVRLRTETGNEMKSRRGPLSPCPLPVNVCVLEEIDVYVLHDVHVLSYNNTTYLASRLLSVLCRMGSGAIDGRFVYYVVRGEQKVCAVVILQYSIVEMILSSTYAHPSIHRQSSSPG